MLDRAASDTDLIHAAVANHKSWMSAAARVTGGEVVHERGLTWIAPPQGGEAAVPFPPGEGELLYRAPAGRGDVAALERLRPTPELLAARLANGYDLAGVARNAGHPDAAAWLTSRAR